MNLFTLLAIVTVSAVASWLIASVIPEFSQINTEQSHYLTLDTDQRMDFILNEMSCETILASVDLHKSVEPIPLVFNEDGTKTRAETLEECWDHCQVLQPDYVPEPDHYFIHIPFSDDGYMFFAGLDEKVEACKNE